MQARTLNGRYRLDQLIGEGGMAVVYRGYDQVLDRVVAIKILRDQYGSDESFVRRFEREAQSAGRLSHPNIANVYDVGNDYNTRYIVMEYVNGANLKELIRRQGPFSVDGAAFIIRQVAGALDYAHSRGLVHRDIKPQNILVDENGVAKVVDFGIAKGLSDSNLTEAGTGMGTVHYVSPEQAGGERATPSSDIYSTGIVLYEMLTKHLPFDADTPVGVAMQHVSVQPPPPSEFNPSIPVQIDNIVMKALAKHPADRYRTASALASALENWSSAGSADETRYSPAAVGAGVGATTVVRPPRTRASVGSGRGGRPPVRTAQDQTFRDDVGCVTWLIGSAILIGLIGLVVLAFRLGDFSFFDPDPTEPAAVVTETAEASPTGGISTATATSTPTATATATVTATATATPTPEATPTATPTPTPEATPSPTPETVNVPQLVGSTLEQARTAVLPGEFELVVTEAFSSVVPAGEIFEQSPAPETRLEKGQPIQVTVSRGPEFIPIPNVQGRPFTQVKGELEALGLTVNDVSEPNTDIAEGRVIRAEPANQVASGGTVTLYVSMGDNVMVPNVYGVPVAQAAFTLEQAGLVVGSQMAQSCSFIQQNNPSFPCDSFLDGGVVSGTLQWDSWVPRGSQINIAYYDADADD